MAKYLGADYPIEKQLLDSDSNPIPIADLAFVTIFLVHRISGDQLIKWKYPNDVAYKNITIVDPLTGEIKFYIDDSETTSAKVGLYDLEYKIAQVNANYSDGYYEDVEIELYDEFIDNKIKSE